MLPTKIRVNKGLFPEIIKNSPFLRGNHFYLRYIDKKDEKPSRFSFVVPTKFGKTSVQRHWIKRRMSAVVEGVVKQTLPGFLVVVFVQKTLSSNNFQEIKEEILDLLKKAKILKI